MKKNKYKKLIYIAGVTVLAVAGFLYAYFRLRDTGITVQKTDEITEETDKYNDITDTPAAPTDIPYIYVYVCGAVENPGLYSLPAGTRGLVAVEEAGGFTSDADRDYLNLAAVLSDGERLYIPFLSDTMDMGTSEKIEGSVTGSSSASNGKININTAGLEELMTLSGIGEARAQDIIEYRTKVGAFLTTEEIMNVSGIGEARYEKIKDSITVD